MRLLLPSLLLTALSVTGPAHAETTQAAESCQGKLATIVDLDGGEVQGTPGNDVIVAAGESEIVAGDGSDTICFQEGYVFAGRGRDSVYVAGDLDGEYLDIRDAEDLDLTTGPGGGFVQLVDVRKGNGTVDLSGGAALTLIGKDEVSVDLEDDEMLIDRARFTLLGNPSIFAIARRVELVGDAADNNLSINQFACQISIKGGRGDDRLTVAGSDGDLPFPENCGSSPSRLYGQRGNDLLQGRGGPDVLIGGPGSDEARGGFGTDTCKAERERNCER